VFLGVEKSEIPEKKQEIFEKNRKKTEKTGKKQEIPGKRDPQRFIALIRLGSWLSGPY